MRCNVEGRRRTEATEGQPFLRSTKRKALTIYGTCLITPHLLMRPLSSSTILPDRWSSISSNSPT
jgi:hypothetical protein